MGTCCEGFGKHWIVFSFMQRFAWLPQGRLQGKQKMKAGVSKDDDFVAIVVRITGNCCRYTADTLNALYLPNAKAYERQTW